MLESHAMSSPQINNGPFCFYFEERKGKERRKKGERDGEIDNAIHQMLVFCFNAMEARKEEKRKDEKTKKEMEKID